LSKSHLTVTMVLQVFWTILHYANRSKGLEWEQSSSGSILAGTERAALTGAQARTQAFHHELHAKIKQAGSLSKLRTSGNGLKWAMVKNTGYDVGPGRKNAFENIAATVIQETDKSVLISRQKLLRMNGWSTLRTALHLATNEWLSWAGGGLDTRKFEYWDQIPDQPIVKEVWYGEAKRERIQGMYDNDLDQLTKLGDFLSTHPLLCNNPQESVKKRVIDRTMHKAIKYLLDVGGITFFVGRG
jgi:hypothetical protein